MSASSVSAPINLKCTGNKFVSNQCESKTVRISATDDIFSFEKVLGKTVKDQGWEIPR